MKNKVEKEEVEINNKTNPKQIQETFERNGWELDSIRLNKDKMIAVFIRKDG